MIERSLGLLESFLQSSEMFGNAFETTLENLRNVVGNLRKIVRNAVISMSSGKLNIYTFARRYEFYVRVARTISDVPATRK